MKTLFASILVVVSACNNDPLDPGAGSSPGRGTNTLLVDGNVNAEPHEGFSNAARATDFDTDFEVRITLNGAQVRTGTVTVASKFVNVPLAWTDVDGGMWIGRAAGYDEVYQLDVVSGADTVEGVIVDGPDFHVFTTPLQGATLDSTLAIDVKWDRDDAADTATFRVGDLGRITIPDSKLYTMAPNSLQAEKDQPRENTIDLRRMNHVAPAGAISGSDFAVSVSNTLDVIAQANPNLP